jgi:predicted nucleic acid-binding protein
MDQARDFVSAHPNLSARDAVHAAVVRVYNLEGICTFDLDFDTIPSITRIIP